MPRSNAVYKDSYNRCLEAIAEIGTGGNLPPETEIAETWGISRTTVRAVLQRLSKTGIIDWEGRRKAILRLPRGNDFFTNEETITTAEKVETAFMELILGGDLAPGTILRESELARSFGTSPSAVREFLIRFSRFGLIEKEPNRHWVLRGFTRSFAEELFDVRELFEQRAFDRMLERGPEDNTWKALVAMQGALERMGADIDKRYMDFPRMDEAFHKLLFEQLENRFVEDFFGVVTMVFHYHYRWRKSGELARNRLATREHLEIIAALREGDRQKARDAFRRHLQSARTSLLDSVHWDEEG
ncbi:GntR family transcriptional regulator [Aliiruegeria sabulilitoris]|uniref:GntR family transcriptional regulator n=1 Tax=Aliiruegeria sabulilitoris TaxID=1510458 RepID=UPI00082E18AC|nr:GntR family transcriptional regulator [Aliiruegeria sabulilitoris]NDR55576.1 GntR family transcriptional regulator [Pseudoruegeria sp. M32A2M]